MNQEKEEQGFTISDRRFSAKKEQAPPAEADKKAEEPASTPAGQEAADPAFRGAAREEPPAQEQELPPINFVSFLLSLSNSALICLGEVQGPGSEKIETNLPLARQTIDILGMLKEKTKGNLEKEEEMLLDDLLYDLRMRYVKKANP